VCFLVGLVWAILVSRGWQRKVVLSAAAKASIAISLIVWRHVGAFGLITELVVTLAAVALFVLLEVQFPSWWFLQGMPNKPDRSDRNLRFFGLTALLVGGLSLANLLGFAIKKGPIYPPGLMIGMVVFVSLAVCLGLIIRRYRLRRQITD
ncbi:MAG: hypothetical protein ACRD6I_15260, partial [Candidatus Acidiferrales bacterium]